MHGESVPWNTGQQTVGHLITGVLFLGFPSLAARL